ncbi:MAG: YbaB/EbfC family nucleoid-associated protein, partial [Phaeodactylibacter sp.]|nr:YbaB/EbfC family nucleoid-associated protein [Phaeodactylibacter sp.]
VATGDQRILDISINKEAIDWEDSEQVEDLVMTAVNRALDLAGEKAAAASEEMLKDMMPPGLGGLSNLFGG